MAWEESPRQNRTIMSGDKPIDEMALALQKMSTAYEDRFDRKPTVAEILYALEIVLLSDPEAYVCDAAAIETQTIFE